ncbi:MAG TPA: thioesterase domain-containing protein [Verrucomicrobiae bacterium]|jgi:thioesterase domain-containing protein|nr:thioesterase domain-containing protein [Verrucomicrobiae bacterium]
MTTVARQKPLDPLEVIVRDIWKDVLGLATVGVSDRFGDLGGTPALAARMVQRVEGSCGRALPVAACSLDVTVASLAAVLKDPEQRGRGARKYIGRNLGPAHAGRRPELFLMHGDMNGGGFYCLALAGHLGKDQPVHAFAPHGVDGTPLPAAIEAMVAEPLAALRRLRPHGPYRLAGYCNGALVAYEIARALAADGEPVERLILIAPVLPAAVPPPTRWTPRQAWGGIRRRVARLAGRRGAPAPDPPAAPLVPTLFERYHPVVRRYRPGRFDGPVTIFWPAEEPRRVRVGSSRAWRRAAPGARMRRVPGAHLTAITTHVAELARQMRACLDGED